MENSAAGRRRQTAAPLRCIYPEERRHERRDGSDAAHVSRVRCDGQAWSFDLWCAVRRKCAVPVPVGGRVTVYNVEQRCSAGQRQIFWGRCPRAQQIDA